MVVYELRCREISREQAEREICDYIQKHPGKDAFDVAIALRLEPKFCFDICDKLQEAGVLEPVLAKKS